MLSPLCSKSTKHRSRLRSKKLLHQHKHSLKPQLIKNRTLNRASKLIKPRNQSLLSKLETRPKPLLMNNSSSKKKIKLQESWRSALPPLPLIMLRWELRLRLTSLRKIRTRSFQFHQTSFTLATRRKIIRKKIRRKMSLLKPNSTVLTHPLNQQPLPWPKKLHKMPCNLRVVNQPQILSLKLLQTWRTPRVLLNLRRVHLKWLMLVLAVKTVLLRTNLRQLRRTLRRTTWLCQTGQSILIQLIIKQKLTRSWSMLRPRQNSSRRAVRKLNLRWRKASKVL